MDEDANAQTDVAPFHHALELSSTLKPGNGAEIIVDKLSVTGALFYAEDSNLKNRSATPISD